MTKETAVNCYWKYYQSLESQVVKLEQFIEFDLAINGKVYSSEIIKLYQATCSEIDVIGKELASLVNPMFKYDRYTNIFKWWNEIQNRYSMIQSEVITLDKTPIVPWKGFFVSFNGRQHVLEKKGHTPDWWVSYNNVKHNRTRMDSKKNMFYTQASLRNLLYSLAALFLLEVLLIEKVGASVDESALFSCNGHRIFNQSFGFIGE